MKYQIFINNEDFTEYSTIPLILQNTLDDSLDMFSFKLNYTNIEKPFTPLSNVLIIAIDEFNNIFERSFFVSNDNVKENIVLNNYTHEILLTEQTKWTERFTGIVKANTTPLVKDYEEASQYVPFQFTQISPDGMETSGYVYEDGQILTTENFSISKIRTPFLEKQITIPSYDFLFDFATLNGNFFYQKTELLLNGKVIETISNEFSEHTFNIIEQGEYIIKYTAEQPYPLGTTSWFVEFGTAYKNIQTTFTIKNVIDDLLCTFETLFEDEVPRFTLNEEQSIEFESIQAPDFNLTGTLWECLSQIGGFIHATPRLNNGVIYFDKLGQIKETSVDLSDYVSSEATFNIEQFVSGIDSTIDNIVNIDDRLQGTIADPFLNGFKTVRTDKGIVQLTSDNILFETTEPIEDIVSVEIGYISDNRLVGDITPYIFEAAEYEALSIYLNYFPASRAFALKYTQGQKNITGLNFKQPNAVHEVFSRPAILNIIARKLGINVSSIANENTLNLQYKITYIPNIKARVKQVKSVLEDFYKTSFLDYNQTAQKINSSAYGENMKGVVARLGNPEITKVYYFNDLTKIPKVGELFGEYYISIVKVEFLIDGFKLEIALSKNFNKLNDYVGINSQKRFYEVSEKQAFERPIVHEDYCVIGDPYVGDNKSLITKSGLQKFVGQFTTFESVYDKPLDVVKAKGFSKFQENLTTVLLPLNTFGMGNSIVFHFHYEDNFTAGSERVVESSTQLQNQVPYTDFYGRIESLKLEFGHAHGSSSSYQEAIEIGNVLPNINEQLSNVNILSFDTSSGNPEEFFKEIEPAFITKENNNIVVKKDNVEILYITYQIHFVTTNNTYVLGSSLSNKNCFVSSALKNSRVLILQNKLNKFDSTINGNLEYDHIFDSWEINGNTATLPAWTAAKSGVAWALYDSDNKLILGQNIDIKNGDTINAINFTFTHKIN